MLQTIRGVWEEDGRIRVLENVPVQFPAHVLITVLHDVGDTATASESALAKDWLSEDEEEAWSHLQRER